MFVAANRVPSWISSITRNSFFHSSGPHSAKLSWTFAVLKRSARALQQLIRTLHSLLVRLSVTSVNISLWYCSIYTVIYIKKKIFFTLISLLDIINRYIYNITNGFRRWRNDGPPNAGHTLLDLGRRIELISIQSRYNTRQIFIQFVFRDASDRRETKRCSLLGCPYCIVICQMHKIIYQLGFLQFCREGTDFSISWQIATKRLNYFFKYSISFHCYNTNIFNLKIILYMYISCMILILPRWTFAQLTFLKQFGISGNLLHRPTALCKLI